MSSDILDKDKDELKESLKIIQRHKIYFGHMSVGENILNGIADISKKYDIHINIINLHQTKTLPETYFAHSFVGENNFPETKCNDFAQTIERYLVPGLEYAFIKFCFVDINRETNIEETFSLYESTIDSLQKKYPEIRFVHFTVPLISHHVDWYINLKRFIKKVISRRDYSPLDNIKRNEYNGLLRQRYENGLIFDIAQVQSTYPDGSREIFDYDNKKYYSLIFEYTYDSGHLNELGRQLVATEMIKFLAKCMKEQEYIK